jgi:hypothetical protein
MSCKYCGADPRTDSRVALRRVNRKGDIGVWVCAHPACVASLTVREQVWYQVWGQAASSQALREARAAGKPLK